MPCTAAGKSAALPATMSGNCTFRVSGGVPLLSAAGQTKMPPLRTDIGRVTHGLRCGAQAK